MKQKAKANKVSSHESHTHKHVFWISFQRNICDTENKLNLKQLFCLHDEQLHERKSRSHLSIWRGPRRMLSQTIVIRLLLAVVIAGKYKSASCSLITTMMLNFLFVVSGAWDGKSSGRSLVFPGIREKVEGEHRRKTKPKPSTTTTTVKPIAVANDDCIALGQNCDSGTCCNTSAQCRKRTGGRETKFCCLGGDEGLCQEGSDCCSNQCVGHIQVCDGNGPASWRKGKVNIRLLFCPEL